MASATLEAVALAKGLMLSKTDKIICSLLDLCISKEAKQEIETTFNSTYENHYVELRMKQS